MARRHVHALTGAATSIATIAAFALVPDGPSEATASPAQIISYVSAQAGTIRLSILLGVIASALLVAFVLSAAGRLKAAGYPVNAQVATVCAVMAAGLTLASSAIRLPLVRENLTGATTAALQGYYGLNDLADALGDVTLAPIGGLLFALALPGWNRVGMPRTLAVIGLALGTCCALAAFSVLDGPSDGPLSVPLAIAFVFWPMWILAVSVAGAATRSRPQTSAAVAASAPTALG